MADLQVDIAWCVSVTISTLELSTDTNAAVTATTVVATTTNTNTVATIAVDCPYQLIPIADGQGIGARPSVVCVRWS